jgi:hypothetical protein
MVSPPWADPGRGLFSISVAAARFSDLGPNWHDRIAPLCRKRQLAELERLSGKQVLLQDAAA